AQAELAPTRSGLVRRRESALPPRRRALRIDACLGVLAVAAERAEACLGNRRGGRDAASSLPRADDEAARGAAGLGQLRPPALAHFRAAGVPGACSQAPLRLL